MALGASRAAVLRQVMTEGIRLTLFGVGLGLMGAAALSRFMTTLLFGVAPADPVTLAAVVPTLALVAASPARCPRGAPPGSIRPSFFETARDSPGKAPHSS
jgi:putative ABC transport system permease protein